VSQKRVAAVLASLVGAMTLSAAALLLMEGGSVGRNMPAAMGLQAPDWNYIIIYESGDQAGNVATLADGFLNGEQSPHTVRPKAHFHFVINSARSRNGADGKLEVGMTWRKQELGAPHAGWPDIRYSNYLPYKEAVGICLIGDLNRDSISKAQHQKLLQLVQSLQSDLKIENRHVIFQWELEKNRVGERQKDFANNFRKSMK